MKVPLKLSQVVVREGKTWLAGKAWLNIIILSPKLRIPLKKSDLPSGLATYLDKYLTNHISEKDLREKILLENPVPSNTTNEHILDEYITEPLLKNKKSKTNKSLNHENF